VKERGIAFLAGLWRLLAAIWTLVIVSALAGALGNIIYTLATTGAVTFANLHSLTSWLSTNLVWVIIVFLAILALTVCAYVAHRHQLREIKKQQQAQNDQLVNYPTQGDRKGPIHSSSPPPPLQRHGVALHLVVLVRAGVEWCGAGTLAVALGWGASPRHT
jgi:hypothetical protein